MTRRLPLRLARLVSLVFLAALGCSLLMRFAPGHFSDVREMDANYASAARSQISSLQQTQGSPATLLAGQLRSWSHGDLGTSRQYGVPVAELLGERAKTSFQLLIRGIGLGWLLAIALALPLSGRRTTGGELAIITADALLLAIPAGVLATIALLSSTGPVLVLALLVAARDFKLLYRLLRSAWRVPFVLHGRAQGFSFGRIFRAHLLPLLGPECFALVMMSFIVALSALVPLEVLFNLPGLGQLAWSAAMNRDLPVLTAVTTVLALCIGLAETFTSRNSAALEAACV